jgi:uncharacterized membrane protein YhaH (DUF805 family)
MVTIGHRKPANEVERRHRRTNRKTYLIEVASIIGAMLLIEFALHRFGVPDLWIQVATIPGLLLLIGRAFLGRSHDLGRTDEWTLVPLAIFAAGWLVPRLWTEVPLAVEAFAHIAWVSALVVPALFRGNEGENRFGTPPEDTVEVKMITNFG